MKIVITYQTRAASAEMFFSAYHANLNHACSIFKNFDIIYYLLFFFFILYYFNLKRKRKKRNKLSLRRCGAGQVRAYRTLCKTAAGSDGFVTQVCTQTIFYRTVTRFCIFFSFFFSLRKLKNKITTRLPNPRLCGDCFISTKLTLYYVK